MVVITGLTKALTHQIGEYLDLKRANSGYRIIDNPTSQNDANIYNDRYISQIAASVTEFAVYKRKKRSENLVPAFLTVLYVPTPDSKRLVEFFGYSAHLVPLHDLAERLQDGRLKRHDLEDAQSSLERNFFSSTSVKEDISKIIQRISRLVPDEELLLPPTNFRLSEDEGIASKFSAYINGSLGWDDRISDELSKVDLRSTDGVTVKHRGSGHTYVDYEQIAFPPADPGAYHGDVRRLENEAMDLDRKLLLWSLFRFGAPLPSGFHHDAQRPDGRHLKDQRFFCSRVGNVFASGTHVAIYPNDCIRK